MKQTGHIEIKDNELRFVYHESPMPGGQFRGEDDDEPLDEKGLLKAMKIYEASKREIEVSNDLHYPISHCELMDVEGKIIRFKHNQPCEAEVENSKAIITKIT